MSELAPLVRLAVLGTRQAPLPEELGPVEDAVLRALGEVPLERRLLLAVGARAVARAAGRKLPRPGEEVEAAPAETLAECPPRTAAALAQALRQGHAEVLREAFALLAHAGRCLPPELLPQVLRDKALRSAAQPVLGERGKWLAGLNPEWKLEVAEVSDDLPDAERRWAEGTSEERRAVLTRLRAREPARAREWLQSTWAKEKAEQRAELLACLEVGLSLEDEALLEQGRKDRAGAVREVARRLLGQLPGSAYLRRMAERARSVLSWEERPGGGAEPRLAVQLPNQWDAEAERDGLDKPPAGVGRSDYWLTRLLACVPPPRWEEWLECSPEELLAAAGGTEHAVALSMGWAEGCRLGGASRWVPALLTLWAPLRADLLEPERAEQLACAALMHLSPAERAQWALGVMRGRERLPSLASALALVPAPWPLELGQAWVALLQGMRMDEPRPVDRALLTTLRQACLALPAECLAAAAEPVELPLSLSRWEQELQRFQDMVALRRIIHEELRP